MGIPPVRVVMTGPSQRNCLERFERKGTFLKGIDRVTDNVDGTKAAGDRSLGEIPRFGGMATKNRIRTDYENQVEGLDVVIVGVGADRFHNTVIERTISRPGL